MVPHTPIAIPGGLGLPELLVLLLTLATFAAAVALVLGAAVLVVRLLDTDGDPE